MNGIITNIKRMSIHDGDGFRTTVFFKGCPLRCVWCHNPDTYSVKKELAFFRDSCILCGACKAVCPEGSIAGGLPKDKEKCRDCMRCADACPTLARAVIGEERSADELCRELLADKPFFDFGGGVTLSGGECLFQADFAVELARLLTESGVSVTVDTSGFADFSVFERIIPYTEAFLYDIKAVDPVLHKKFTGQDNKIIIENLCRLDALGCKIEIRYPYILGYNDGEVRAIGELLSGLRNTKRIKVLPYHSFARSKYAALGLKDTLPEVSVTREDVERAVEVLRGFGLDAVNGAV